MPRIPDLPAATALTGTEQAVVLQDNITKRVGVPLLGGGVLRIGAAQNIGAAISLAVGAAQVFQLTATAASGTVTFTGLQAGSEWTVQHRQDAVGGRRTVFSGVTWLAGAGVVKPAPNAVDVFNFYSPDGVAIFGFQSTAVVPSPTFPGAASTAIQTTPRLTAMSARGLNLNATNISLFTPDRDQVVSNLQSFANGTLAAGATVARMGLALASAAEASVTYTTIARTANDTTLWTATGFARRAIVDDGQGATITSVLLRAGVLYAFLLQFNGTTAPQVAGFGSAQGAFLSVDASGKLPRLSGFHAQADIPASFVSTSQSASYYWGACD